MFVTRRQVLGVSERDFMGNQGLFFVDFVGQYGYDRVLSVLGRHMRDFLNGKSSEFNSSSTESPLGSITSWMIV